MCIRVCVFAQSMFPGLKPGLTYSGCKRETLTIVWHATVITFTYAGRNEQPFPSHRPFFSISGLKVWIVPKYTYQNVKT